MTDIEKLQHYMIAGKFKEQKEIANFLEISPARISDWKKTGIVPKKHLKKLGEKFGFLPSSLKEEKISSNMNTPEALKKRMSMGGRTPVAYAKVNSLQATAVTRLLSGETTGTARNSNQKGATYEILKCFKRDGIWQGLLPFTESSSFKDDIFDMDNISKDLQRLESESNNISDDFKKILKIFKKSLAKEKENILNLK